LLTTDSNNEVASGSAMLQSTTAETYSVASLKGNFSIQLKMWTADVNQEEDGAIGIITFDGKGNFKGKYLYPPLLKHDPRLPHSSARRRAVPSQRSEPPKSAVAIWAGPRQRRRFCRSVDCGWAAQN